MDPAKLPRGIALNNPGCLRKSNDRWQGLATPPHDGTFFRFATPQAGIRAIAKTLITYQDRRLATDGSVIDTVQEIIERWAPPAENDTMSYVRSVRQQMGYRPGERVHVDCHDFTQMKALVCAIIQHECGTQPYDDATITKGLVMAGLEPPKAPVAKSRTMKGGLVALAGTALAGLGEGAQEAAPIVSEWYRPALDLIGGLGVPTWAFLAVAVIGIGIIMYARWDDSRKGLR